MKTILIQPIEYPIEKGESWWIVHPNNPNSEFRIPQGGVAVVQNEGLDGFIPGRAYPIVDNDPHNGWLTVLRSDAMVRMPYYVFARYFDSEAFITGRFSIVGQEVEAFNYRPTLPGRPTKQLELFNDQQFGLRPKDEPEWRK